MTLTRTSSKIISEMDLKQIEVKLFFPPQTRMNGHLWGKIWSVRYLNQSKFLKFYRFFTFDSLRTNFLKEKYFWSFISSKVLLPHRYLKGYLPVYLPGGHLPGYLPAYLPEYLAAYQLGYLLAYLPLCLPANQLGYLLAYQITY